MNQEGFGAVAQEAWRGPRVVNLQYASDAMAFFSPDLFLSAPDWLSGPRAPDVADAFHWAPLVTGVQVGFDMILSSAVPAGFGHRYAAGDYMVGWRAALDLNEWDDASFAALKARLEEQLSSAKP
jgi:uncharacterized membrane protein